MKRQHGFTLVEVLVAVAIVAIALAAGLRASGVLVDNAQRLSDVLAAQWCAENYLTNLKLTRQFPGIGETAFACEQLGREYQGRALIAGTQYADLRLADAIVSDDAGRQLVRLTTLLYRP
ncbi:MAG TPA: type II secretion system minor pseudopilin GspI [Rubrivivax sp.]|nr:type II secretion system minor pseudopilin GspI [Rubrivivax sp.]